MSAHVIQPLARERAWRRLVPISTAHAKGQGITREHSRPHVKGTLPLVMWLQIGFFLAGFTTLVVILLSS
jgi:hypothetical protein